MQRRDGKGAADAFNKKHSIYQMSGWLSLKIPRDLTEASLSGAGLSIVAALAMVFLFGMELSSYLAVNTTTSVIVDRSSDGEFLRIDFNISIIQVVATYFPMSNFWESRISDKCSTCHGEI
ncbi:protein disulfide isomerase-like 5-4 isoform X2 [Miscanthus floridulus]|uniref:protein disulfide isomerase-like 5-4 isoform X2 n=1 Tax=Miscanthus floridulus TaxID=154761 RepID=UPI0034598BBA